MESAQNVSMAKVISAGFAPFRISRKVTQMFVRSLSECSPTSDDQPREPSLPAAHKQKWEVQIG